MSSHDQPADRAGIQKEIRNRKKGKWGRFFLRWGMTGGVLFVLFLFIIQIVPYHGIGMYPSIRDGDLVVIYRAGSYRIGDVIRYKDTEGTYRLGRIAATGNEVVEIEDSGEWTRNGDVPNDFEFYATGEAADSPVVFPYTVSNNTYFILNDYRMETHDSRLFGSVPAEQITGRVIFVFRIRGI